uniref:MqnA/MqnD/SBP family protein n=1 Tax=Alistipes ihumii TaxID=1470347 RepID=UPI003FF0D2E4
MKLKLSISTCPNDTFMFDAMLHRRIDTEGLDFDLTMADIEQLNAAALAGEPDITKLSYASFPLVADRCRVSGSGPRRGG